MPQVLCNKRGEDGRYELPSDGLYHWSVLGVAPNRNPETGEPILQVVDDEALTKIMANVRASGELLVDKEHLSEMADGDSSGYGWAQPEGLEVREDGLYGPIRLTALGNDAVRGGVFRYLSPVFEWESAEDLGDGRFRPTKLLSLGLTNKPNFSRIRALSNRSADDADGRRFGCFEEPMKEKTNTKDRSSATDSGASGEEILQLRNRVQELETENKELRDREVESILDAHKDVLANDEARAGMKTLLLANREQGLSTLKALNEKPNEESKEQPERLFNTKKAAQPGVSFHEVPKASAEDEARANRVRSEAHKLMNSQTGLGFAEAFRLAESTVS